MYVDGFLVPVKRDRIDDYKQMATTLGALWIKYGALSVTEAMGDDVPEGKVTSFPMAVKLEPGEVVFFSWITFHDRAHRDKVNAAVMADPSLNMSQDDPPMNLKRMIWGGFVPVVHLTPDAPKGG
jgi:uncharacterized protein YbaA (DUF1428 family)